ncbi:MAG: VOC family protein [Polyangiaceae bacterium]|nr:VOC family protein [Polyangiaceae bacterium]
MAFNHKIAPCLWFDDQGEEAAKLYVSIFKNSGIDHVTRYGKVGFEIHGRPEGSVMTVEFHLDGCQFTALNGGPQFKFSEAISLQVYCDDQAEIDHFWTKLIENGGAEGPCGWLKDKFGLSWQIVPKAMFEMLKDPDKQKSERVTKAFLQMKKFDIAALQRAFEGK